jgi:hypothetical protein
MNSKRLDLFIDYTIECVRRSELDSYFLDTYHLTDFDLTEPIRSNYTYATMETHCGIHHPCRMSWRYPMQTFVISTENGCVRTKEGRLLTFDTKEGAKIYGDILFKKKNFYDIIELDDESVQEMQRALLQRTSPTMGTST